MQYYRLKDQLEDRPCSDKVMHVHICHMMQEEEPGRMKSEKVMDAQQFSEIYCILYVYILLSCDMVNRKPKRSHLAYFNRGRIIQKLEENLSAKSSIEASFHSIIS